MGARQHTRRTAQQESRCRRSTRCHRIDIAARLRSTATADRLADHNGPVARADLRQMRPARGVDRWRADRPTVGNRNRQSSRRASPQASERRHASRDQARRLGVSAAPSVDTGEDTMPPEDPIYTRAESAGRMAPDRAKVHTRRCGITESACAWGDVVLQ